MPLPWLFALIAGLAVAGYIAGRTRARSFLREGARIHSRPGYHASHVMIWVLLPAAAVLLIGLSIEPAISNAVARSNFPEEVSRDGSATSLAFGVVQQVAEGLVRLGPDARELLLSGAGDPQAILADVGMPLGDAVEPYMLRAAESLVAAIRDFRIGISIAAPLAAFIGGLIAWRQLSPGFRARNVVERAIRYLFIAASTVAVLTTFGIVMSLLYESLRFFSQISPLNFFFGTTWDPRFSAPGFSSGAGGQFGLLPLLWGTLYISLIALIVAVPIGLFAAVYMSEYASRRVRSVAKPLLEVLAGIPTIVYGFFALTVVGPAIRDFISAPLGFGTSGSSVMTAGLVMGIMIIPFVSSLSDDIINAVPQTLRDGSYALGATRSETIRRVILPAALPGIVGAVLLAASRAVGETMIVVLAAGVATRISLNPFEEMTTITVKIVSQLTGDTEFTSPQTLVAFALGLTLFAVTLAMNIYALHIVRKYREQYE